MERIVKYEFSGDDKIKEGIFNYLDKKCRNFKITKDSITLYDDNESEMLMYLKSLDASFGRYETATLLSDLKMVNLNQTYLIIDEWSKKRFYKYRHLIPDGCEELETTYQKIKDEKTIN